MNQNKITKKIQSLSGLDQVIQIYNIFKPGWLWLGLAWPVGFGLAWLVGFGLAWLGPNGPGPNGPGARARFWLGLAGWLWFGLALVPMGPVPMGQGPGPGPWAQWAHGLMWAHLGPWAHLGAFGPILGPFWSHMGAYGPNWPQIGPKIIKEIAHCIALKWIC